MSKERMNRRSMLRTSGAALATLSGVSLVGNAAACPGCGGGGGGGGGSGIPPTVSTGHAFVDGDRVTVYGYLDSLGSADSANVWFDWGPYGEGLPDYTRLYYMDSTGQFCDGVMCSYDSFGSLDPGTYEFRAFAQADGTDAGHTPTFQIY